jgi:HAD superfamily hydrolase (TIGR01509 family)
MRFADFDAVTIDAHGTLVEVLDPVPALQRSLAERGIERDAAAVAGAFAAEGAHYVERTSTGRDEQSLHRLRVDCAGVFLDHLGAELDPESFVPSYMAALVFAPLDGVVASLSSLRARGLALAVVSNWDMSLGDVLTELGLAKLVDSIVTSAGVGADKPDPAIFHAALEALGVEPGRTVHIGDRDVDEQGARASGMHFAAAPVTRAVAELAQ